MKMKMHRTWFLAVCCSSAFACSNLVEPTGAVTGNGVTDDTVAIQAAIDATPGCTIRFGGTHTYLISAFLTLPSYSHLIFDSGATVFLKNGSLLPDKPAMLTNANWVEGNVDISIEGPGVLDGNQPNQVRSFTTAWPGQIIELVNVRWVRITNITLRHPPSFFVHCATCYNAQFDHIYLDGSLAVVNTDGIHISGPASNILIDTLTGITGDDTVCLCAGEVATTYMPSTGNISDVLVQNMNVTAQWNGIRLHVNSEVLSRVVIQNIAGAYTQSGVDNGISTLSTNGDRTPDVYCVNPGMITNIQYDNISATSGSGNFLYFAVQNSDVAYSNVTGSTAIKSVGCSGSPGFPVAGDTATSVSGPPVPIQNDPTVGLRLSGNLRGGKTRGKSNLY